jgi:1,4-dihydroxy-2-naphthoate octaprenyltransferase
MLQVSRYLFNPAVLLGLLGFVALILGTANFWIIVIGCGALILGLLYAVWRRPNLGAD